MLWFVEKEYVNELEGIESIGEMFYTLNQMVKNKKAIEGVKIGKSIVGVGI